MKLLEHPDHFKEGVRILMLLLRAKEGGKGNVDRHAIKVITSNPKEYDAAMKALTEQWEPNYRIYATVDKRDVKKAMRRFKELILENDYTPNPEEFFLDMENRWISALQQPTSRAESHFLIDFDSQEDAARGIEELAKFETEKGNEFVHGYQTKNGWHIITKPFNYTKLPEWMHPLIHKNGMMLLAY